MAITNATLAQQISDLIGHWDGFNEEYAGWLGGSVGGGPSSDGKYPLTDYRGVVTLVDSPAKLADTVSNTVSGAAAHKTAAETAQAAAEVAQAAAELAETNVDVSEALALAYRDAALAAQAAAESARSMAIPQAGVATTKASEADTSATAAAASETAAGTSETNAASSASAAAASAVEAATFDPDLYAALGQIETITSLWTFADRILFSGPPANDWPIRLSHGAAGNSGFWYSTSERMDLYLRDDAGNTNALIKGDGTATFTGALSIAGESYGAGTHAQLGHTHDYFDVNFTGVTNVDIDTVHTGRFYGSQHTNVSNGTVPESYVWVANLGGNSVARGLQLASTYGSDNNGFWMRRRSDNAGSENGALAWQNWKQIMSKEWADTLYLPLAGGTMTGNLAFNTNALVGANNAWSDANDGVSNGHGHITFGRLDSSATNVPIAVNNANGLLSLSSRGGTYGKQLYFTDNEDLYIRQFRVSSSFQPWRKLWHDGHFDIDDYLPLAGGTVTGASTFTADTTFQQEIDAAYGINGGYSRVSGNVSFGATIWSLDQSFQGGAAGNSSSATAVYGLRWHRISHPEALSHVGEGLYLHINGTLRAALGISGSFVTGGIREASSGNYLHYDDSTYTYGGIFVQSTAPSSPAKGTVWFDTS